MKIQQQRGIFKIGGDQAETVGLTRFQIILYWTYDVYCTYPLIRVV